MMNPGIITHIIDMTIKGAKMTLEQAILIGAALVMERCLIVQYRMPIKKAHDITSKQIAIIMGANNEKETPGI